MREYIEALYDSLNRLSKCEISLLTFREVFDRLYLRTIPSEIFSDAEFNLFAQIAEIMEKIPIIEPANEEKARELIGDLRQKYQTGSQ
ncbi:MAG: hypothetical protein KME17_21445 [Cyanosarcina radialis HA8281-LM2]|jgi:hypothetical protein|nr:hypothetical protein [Cyanosarcina radialis HA8281-LM2]